MLRAAHHFIDQIAGLPGLAQWRKRRFRRAFAGGDYGGDCDGIFSTYEEAAAAAPTTLPLGYDHAAAARMYRERLSRIYPSDYAMMLWLQVALVEGNRQVFDLGGHVGVGYYAYQKILDFPPDMSWKICDVPAVVEAGRELARTNDHPARLSFTEHFAEGEGSDILFTSGCLQYLQDTLAQRVSSWQSRPRWILINLLPLHGSREYWTVQSIGSAFCPYRIQHEGTFLSEMTALGYHLMDKWENLEKRCEVKFQPAYSLDRYFGAAFRLE